MSFYDNLTMKHEILSKPQFFTVSEVAYELRVSDKTVRRALSRGLFRASKAFRKLLIPREQVETFYERTK